MVILEATRKFVKKMQENLSPFPFFRKLDKFLQNSIWIIFLFLMHPSLVQIIKFL